MTASFKTSVLLASAFAALFESRALASPTFPAVLEEELELETPPPCETCHTTPEGGLGTANTPFARYLRSRGARAADHESLRVALRAAEAEQHDADDDGVPDLEELAAGGDPNAAGSRVKPPSYGCSAAAAGGTRDPYAVICIVLACCARLARRASRTRTKALERSSA